MLKNDVIMCVSLLSHVFRKVDIEWPSFIVINVNSCMPSASFLFFFGVVSVFLSVLLHSIWLEIKQYLMKSNSTFLS